ncbi:hypothetical protein C2845_PM05G27220 [Panicum miliaceum]|uniref:Uncharacterized protein n=1 Tax=Panicum miliaceum TaxID=4540 RepID=A0A3L6T0K7_PANMI|nr:hypothetical protein C2845_PM05G27220 [Panicum miliaceum]
MVDWVAAVVEDEEVAVGAEEEEVVADGAAAPVEEIVVPAQEVAAGRGEQEVAAVVSAAVVANLDPSDKEGHGADVVPEVTPPAVNPSSCPRWSRLEQRCTASVRSREGRCHAAGAGAGQREVARGDRRAGRHQRLCLDDLRPCSWGGARHRARGDPP